MTNSAMHGGEEIILIVLLKLFRTLESGLMNSKKIISWITL
jgi:hypothetical protein